MYGVDLQLLAWLDCGFESRRRQGCLLVSVVCCQLVVYATSRSLVQRSPTACGVCEYDHESWIMMGPWPTGGCCDMVEKTANSRVYSAFDGCKLPATRQLNIFGCQTCHAMARRSSSITDPGNRYENVLPSFALWIGSESFCVARNRLIKCCSWNIGCKTVKFRDRIWSAS